MCIFKSQIVWIPIRITVSLPRTRVWKLRRIFHFLQLENLETSFTPYLVLLKTTLIHFSPPFPTTDMGPLQRPKLFCLILKRMPSCFISRGPVWQIALGRRADRISWAYLPPLGRGQPWSVLPWSSAGPPVPLAGASWPEAFEECALSPACGLGSSASSPRVMMFCCHFQTTYYCLFGI